MKPLPFGRGFILCSTGTEVNFRLTTTLALQYLPYQMA